MDPYTPSYGTSDVSLLLLLLCLSSSTQTGIPTLSCHSMQRLSILLLFLFDHAASPSHHSLKQARHTELL